VPNEFGRDFARKVDFAGTEDRGGVRDSQPVEQLIDPLADSLGVSLDARLARLSDERTQTSAVLCLSGPILDTDAAGNSVDSQGWG
jgi:hypothetical protein